MSGSEADESPLDERVNSEHDDSFEVEQPDTTAAVKDRVSRKLTEKGRLNKISTLKGRLCKHVNKCLTAYESMFGTMNREDFACLEHNLEVLKHDASEVDALHNELNELIDNKSDEGIETMCIEFQREYKHNLDLIVTYMTELEESTDAAAAKEAEAAEREFQEQLRLMKQLKARQAEARQAFQARQVNVIRQAGATTPSSNESGSGSVVSGTYDAASPSIDRTGQTRESMVVVSPIPPSQVSMSPQTQAPPQTPATAGDLSAVDLLAQSITASMRETKRSIIPPSVFTGDVLKFVDWESDFDDFLVAEGITGTRKLRMLKRYIDGEPRRCIDGYLMDNTEEAYDNARKHLKERYGKKINLARQFKRKLAEWPRLRPRDSQGLQDLADFLIHCSSAMKSIPQLECLNDPDQNMAIVEKLPDWLQNKWKYQVAMADETCDEFPKFQTFAQFIKREAKACNVFAGIETLASKVEGRKEVIRDQPTKKLRILKTSSKEQKRHCLYCGKDNHKTEHCHDLCSLPYDETRDWVRSKELCYKCIDSGHRANNCQQRMECKKCKKPHPTILHKTKADWDKENTKSMKPGSNTNPRPGCNVEADNETIDSVDANVKSTKCQTSLLSTIAPAYVSVGDKEVLVYAVLDCQSDANFITNDIAALLTPPQEEKMVTMKTMMGETRAKRKLCHDIKIRSFTSNEATTISAFAIERIPCEKDTIPTSVNTSDLAYLDCIREEIPPPMDLPVGILIGMNSSEVFEPQGYINSPSRGQGPFAIKTMLGWIVNGKANPQHSITSLKTSSAMDKDILKLLERDFKDSTGDKMSQEDYKFLEIVGKGTTRDDSGSYVLPLPFKAEAQLPENRQWAEKRLQQQIRKFESNSKYKEDYYKFMDKLIKNGHAEKTPTEVHSSYYIPHFAVTHPKKKKLRVVFDASAKFKGIALNDTLLQGPDLMNSLVGILMRFRKGNIAICCDIEAMFYNFHVPVEQQDYLRFLWLDENDEIADYRMTRHLFGAISSPAIATYGLRQLASDHQHLSSTAAKFLCEDFYVDDGITSVDSVEAGVKLVNEAIEMCAKGNIRLHKFVSNNRELMRSIPPTERCESTQTIDLGKDILPKETTLGMQWDVETDQFKFDMHLELKPSTKRGILSTVAQVYDPLGLISPFILKGKLVLQSITAGKLPWDAPVSDAQDEEWQKWLQEAKHLKKFDVPRQVSLKDEAAKSVQLHVFCDASTKGYGACCYIRHAGEQEVTTNLVFSKSRVAPLKPVTMPRLELQAAVLAVRVYQQVSKELKLDIEATYFWSDSKIVLGYINNEARRFQIYVANRVQEIHEHTSAKQWSYVSSADNPADLASRGATVEEMQNSAWLRGPDFIKSEAELSKYLSMHPVDKAIDSQDPEIKIKSLKTTTQSHSLLDKLEKYSTWKGMVTAFTRLKLMARNKSWKSTDISVEDRESTINFILAMTQQEAFGKELEELKKSKQVSRDSSIRSLDPFLDETGLIRVGGRVHQSTVLSRAQKHPIIIPKQAYIGKLIASDIHNQMHHAGIRTTVAAIRDAGFWLINGYTQLKERLRKCITCLRLKGHHIEQKMGQLPRERVERTPPFTHVGVDVFGPFYIKERRTELKKWGLIITCLYSRSIHLEMLDDLSTDSFINALRCVTSLRGKIETIFSDQGTNFIGARNEYEAQLKMMKDPAAQKFMKQNMIKFKFNPPDSSHRGGSWERLIRSVRIVLEAMKTKYKSRMNCSSFRTALYEAANIVNSRPITSATITCPTETIITPNHLLTMKSTGNPPPPGDFDDEEIYGRKRWRMVQQFAEEFWQAWRAEYFGYITKRQKWLDSTQNIKQGDIVLVKSDLAPRNEWVVGMVETTNPGKDGLVREATIRIADRNLDNQGRRKCSPTILNRSVQKLVLLTRA